MSRPVRTWIMVLVTLVIATNLYSQTSQTNHTVVSGETLYGIARKYQVSVDQLRQLNGLSTSSVIRIGQQLKIPGTEMTTQPSQQIQGTPNYEVVVVVRGDTLFGLARKYKTTASELRTINNLSESSVLRVGQELKVPSQGPVITTNTQSPNQNPTPPVNHIPDKNQTAETNGSNGTMLDQRRLPDSQQTAVWPVRGEVFSLGGKFPGVAIKTTQGEGVTSLVDGRIIYTGPHSTMGTVVFVQGDNGYVYVYGGNENSLVSTGGLIKSGDKIGTVGPIPGTNEVQAFFTVWKDGVYLDPVTAPRN